MASWTQRKSIGLAFGVVAAIVCTGLVFHLTRSAEEPAKTLLTTPPRTTADGSSKSIVLEKPPLEAEATKIAERADRISASRQSSEELTVLHVAVVSASGAPITTGSIDCDWTGERRVNPLTGQVHAQISGSATEVILPLAAESCTVTASSSGHPAAQVIAAEFRRLKPDGPVLTGRVDHNVRIVLGLSAKGPTLSGSISVNGERRVPDGLRVIVNSVLAKVVIDRAAPSYSVSDFHPTAKLDVRVESDETPLLMLVTPPAGPDGNYRLDLALESKGALFVHAIDDASGKPAAGVALILNEDTITERTIKRTTHGQHAVRKTTDERGDCVFRGFPDEGSLTLRETKDETSRDKPLWSLELARSPLSEIHETIRVNAAKASVWGIIPAPPGSGPGLAASYTVVCARAPEAGRQVAEGDGVRADAEGRWSFDCVAPSEWLVWLAEKDTRVSQVERVVVDRAQPYGPIRLVPATTHDVNLRMTNLPSSGRLFLYITDEAGGPAQRENLELTGSELVHVLRMRGPARVNMTLSVDPPGSKTQTQQSLRIDPERSPDVTVDWHSNRSRRVELLLNGSVPKSEAVISLLKLGDAEELSGAGTMFSLIEGKSARAMPLPGGTYMYVVFSEGEHGAICGIAHVPDSEEPSNLKLDWSGKALPRDTLGSGIALATLDGMSCANLRKNLREIPWPKTWGPEVTQLLVPDNCEYTVMK